MQPKPKTNAHTANTILHGVCKHLQLHDIRNGYANKGSYTWGTGNYMRSYFILSVNPNSDKAPFTLTDVLDDALNCNLISEAQYDYIIAYSKSDKFNHGLRINQH